MSQYPSFEEELQYAAPKTDKKCKTWYRIVGDIRNSSKVPLFLLHGGPGAGHEYLASMVDLFERFEIPLIFYDQQGCGRSTHHRERLHDAGFWTFDLFFKELDNLIDHLGVRERGFYILGQSWGGMLAGSYASLRPKGLRKVVICGGPASFPLFIEGGRRLRAQLPQHIREALEKGDQDKDLKNPEYELASAYFYKKHVCHLDPLPEPVKQAFVNLEDDPTAYHTMQGPSEIVINGTLKDWDCFEASKNINIDTLLVNGRDDEVSELCMEPWFKSIPKVKWVVFEQSSHMPHWEERERFMELVGTFLTNY